MHPAYSVIFFTTASGAGYGLWVWLGLILLANGSTPPGHALALLVLGGLLVTAGLLSSTAHLGHPERAWRALSQWRSSWLSREGVAAVATYGPAAYLFFALILPGGLPGVPLAGCLLALGAVVTVWCTGMIYASLRTIPEWHLGLVPAVYGAIGLGTGALLVAPMVPELIPLALVALVAAAALKFAYWRRIDGSEMPFSIADALGIPGATNIRPLDPPHTQPNFVMREMGYVVARKHADRLRRLVSVLLFAVPVAALCLALFIPALTLLLTALSVLAAAVGVWIERWLFFAEARHLSMLYYPAAQPGADRPA